MKEPVDELLAAINKVTRELAVPLEVAALIESFGYDDRSAKELGFSSVFALAEHLFARLPRDLTPHERAAPSRWLAFLSETRWALRKLPLGLAYAVPWMVLVTLQYLRPEAFQVTAELGGALSLALIASLITTGGFVQVISRSGNFHYGLEEPFVARSNCTLLLNFGLISSLLLALLALILGLYFHVFSTSYLILGAIEYVALSLLWMFCAVLSVQGLSWCVPLTFLLSTLVIGVLKMLVNCGTVTVLMLWLALTVLSTLGCMLAGFRRAQNKHPEKHASATPRYGVWFISLAPFYAYGAAYFAFLFADRVAAGSSISWVSGLSFGIDSTYQRGMDLVLLPFLITAALVEYLSDSFLRFWHRLSAEGSRAGDLPLAEALRKRHWKLMVVALSSFVLIATGACSAVWRLETLSLVREVWRTPAMGGLGYLMLSLALLETIILSSVNAIRPALVALALGLAVNLLTGYGLGHLLGLQYAAAGLLVGSAVVLWRCNSAVREILRHPEYHYAVS
ncbi:MAG: hypothetical protein LAO06_15265 [Acidobacteriia bacterium]|nr:hypothetical protein [Terriglobia bacterium]